RELVAVTQSVTATMVAAPILIYLLLDMTFFRLILITWMMHLILIGGSRLSWKVIHYQLKGKRSNGKGMKRTLIVGAGKGDILHILQMLTNKKNEHAPGRNCG